MTACNRCNMEIKWRVPYVKGDKPLNMDDTPHQCAGAPPVEQGIPAPSQSRLVSPIDRTAVITEIKEFLQAFEQYRPDMLDAASRIYISRTMKR